MARKVQGRRVKCTRELELRVRNRRGRKVLRNRTRNNATETAPRNRMNNASRRTCCVGFLARIQEARRLDGELAQRLNDLLDRVGIRLLLFAAIKVGRGRRAFERTRVASRG